MNKEEATKLIEEEFMKNVMTKLDSALIFTYINNLEKENQELKKQLEERDKWLIVCISELMEEFKKDTFWITNQQIESTKNKNISYEVYCGNDIKFYQNIKK